MQDQARSRTRMGTTSRTRTGDRQRTRNMVQTRIKERTRSRTAGVNFSIQKSVNYRNFIFSLVNLF